MEKMIERWGMEMFFEGILGMQLVLLVISCTATAMLNNYYKGIEESIGIYTDPRAYKPQQRIKVLEQMLQVINPQAERLEASEQVQKQVSTLLAKQKIGCFAYRGVVWTALLGKYVIVALLGALVLLEIRTKQPLNTFFITNTMSLLMSLLMLLVGVVVNVSKQKKNLQDKLVVYITQGYATEKHNQQQRASSETNFEGLDAFSQELEKENEDTEAKEVQIAVESVLKIFEQ